MKVLLLNGSPNEKGCTYTALCEIEKALKNEGIETEIFWIGKKAIAGCIACHSCGKLGKCAFDDKVNEFLDGVVVERPNPTAERNHTENPTSGRTTKSRPFEPSSVRRDAPGEGAPDRSTQRVRPSVRRELEDIRAEQRRKPDTGRSDRHRTGETRHKAPNPPRRRTDKEVR